MLGEPDTGWVGAARVRGGRALRPRRPRRPQPAPPAAARPACGAGARRLDQPRRARLHLPPADDPAGRGLRGGELLRALLARAAAAGRGPRLHRHRLHVPRRARCSSPSSSARSGRPASTPATAMRSGSRARASACASARPRCSLTEAGEDPAERSIAPATRGRRRRGTGGQAAGRGWCPSPSPQHGQPRRCGCCAASAHVDPDEPRRLPRPRRLRALRRAFALGPMRRDPRGVGLQAARPRRRRLPDRAQVGGRRPAARAAALPDLQRRRVRAGHVQGSHRARAGPVRA